MNRHVRMAASLMTAILLYMIPAAALEVSARSAVVLDGDSGEILWEKNAEEPSLIASTTKIMTALVTLEQAEQDAEALRLGDKWVDTDRLFVKWNGLPMHNNTPYFWFSEFCEKHGFRFCDIHSLRHLHCSLLINAGIDVVAVSGDLGHSCVGTTLNLYSHMFQEAKARNCDAITAALSFGKKDTEDGNANGETEKKAS